MNHVQEISSATTLSMCMLRVGGETLGIESSAVKEAVVKCSLRNVPLAPWFVAGVMVYRGDILLAVSLRTLLGLEQSNTPQSAIVMRDDKTGEEFALLLDELVNVITVDRRNWEPNPATLEKRWVEICNGSYRTAEITLPVVIPEAVQPSRLIGERGTLQRIGEEL